MNKKIYVISAAALVALAAGAALGYWDYSQSRYYKLVQGEESASRMALSSLEASNVSAEEMTVSINTATDPKTSPADATKDLSDAQTSFNAIKSLVDGDMPANVNKWKSQVDDSNKTLKKLWVTPNQRRTLGDMNDQYLRLIKVSKSTISDTTTLEPAIQETIKFMQAAQSLGEYSSKYQTQDQMAAHIADISAYSAYAAPGYTYNGEPVVKAKYPTIDAAIISADKTVGDMYLLYKDIADNNLAGALSLAPQVQNESERLSASGDAMNALAKTTATPRDTEIIAAAGKLQQIVSSSSDKKLRQEVGLRKYEAAEITDALDLYGYDHRNTDKNVTYPVTGSLESVVSVLQSGKYLSSASGSIDTFKYSAIDSNQAFTLEYTDELTGKPAKTAGA